MAPAPQLFPCELAIAVEVGVGVSHLTLREELHIGGLQRAVGEQLRRDGGDLNPVLADERERAIAQLLLPVLPPPPAEQFRRLVVVIPAAVVTLA